MIMMGLKFKKEIPFRDVYIHGIVRDKHGRKMSKSLGNVIDPLDVIDKFGTDSLRLSLADMSTLGGQDIFLTEEKLKGSRNFCNKLWNAARFFEIKGTGYFFDNSNQDMAGKIPHLLFQTKAEASNNVIAMQHQQFGVACEAIPIPDLASEWILCRINEEIKEVDSLLNSYRFHEAASSLYEFVWHEFCDWYLEIIKPGLDSEEKEKYLAIFFYVFSRILKLLHPFMPFITEELWHELELGKEDLIISPWPIAEGKFVKKDVKEKMDFLKELITSVRHIRTEASLNPKDRIIIKCKTADPGELSLIRTYSSYIKTLTRADDIIISEEKQDKMDISIQPV